MRRYILVAMTPEVQQIEAVLPTDTLGGVAAALMIAR